MTAYYNEDIKDGHMNGLFGPCAKQTVKAVIINGDISFTGTNHCKRPQQTCPRVGLPTGVGYEMCKEVCDQVGHAEVVACELAGDSARGGTLTLYGHTYCCDQCKRVMEAYGIKEVLFGEIDA